MSLLAVVACSSGAASVMSESDVEVCRAVENLRSAEEEYSETATAAGHPGQPGGDDAVSRALAEADVAYRQVVDELGRADNEALRAALEAVATVDKFRDAVEIVEGHCQPAAE